MPTDDPLREQKKIAFYSAGVEAWFNTSLEHDRSLLALASGGIGLLIVLLTSGRVSSAPTLVLYVCAIVSFGVAIVTILWVFRQNRRYLERTIGGAGPVTDPVLTKLDAVALWTFGLGALFTAIIGVSAAFDSYSAQREEAMANETTKASERVFTQDSFNSAAYLQPVTLLEKSFNNAASLQPQEAPAASANVVADTPASGAVASSTSASQGQSAEPQPPASPPAGR